MIASRMKRPDFLEQVDVSVAAPFLQSVSPMSERLIIQEISKKSNVVDAKQDEDGELAPRSPLDSMIQCTYPLSSSNPSDVGVEILRTSVSDFGNWSSFRLSKFYADVDAITADVAYRHTSVPATHNSSQQQDSAQKNTNISFVTAGHFNSRKLKRTDIGKDVILRSYPTQTGSASMEIRTDVVQLNDEGDSEQLVNVCYTTMVAVDTKTLRPIKNVIPSLILNDAREGDSNERQVMRMDMAKQHNKTRKERMASSMQLSHNISHPPTAAEMEAFHLLYRRRHQNYLLPSEERQCTSQLVSDHTYRSSLVVYPERRNVHGKLFGGFVVEKSHAIAQYAVDFFLHSEEQQPPARQQKGTSVLDRPIPVGLDEAVFLQPISIGDHVTFTARVVHATPSMCRVIVVVEVRNPTDRDRQPLRSNRLSFLFLAAGAKPFPGILPDTYSEMLMYMDASRRYATEGPSDEYVARIQKEQNSKPDDAPTFE
eukprot:CAMPEP_0194255722 /NCGR_PEP_ID=MMETSP0158-20130606/35111_1 /TAXON_ID=33649 /ORGANISM="Thalassionema nitzschioides, Strain L26-B" /LENGTH=482 /DNA_ID=CAMNT_0038994171 /DNA_START=117 /DNA_END=1566 /DNA_ORIENTATION=+